MPKGTVRYMLCDLVCLSIFLSTLQTKGCEVARYGCRESGSQMYIADSRIYLKACRLSRVDLFVSLK